MSIVDSANKYLEVDKRYMALRDCRIRDGNKRLFVAYKQKKESRSKMRNRIRARFQQIVRLLR